MSGRSAFSAGIFIFQVFFCIATALCPYTTASVSAESVPRLLVLNSYNIGYDWSDAELLGFRSTLSKTYKRHDISIENLDTKNFPDKAHFLRQADLIEAKYRNFRFDVIIVMDNAALEFAIRYRQRLFPGIPLVFCGINNYEPAMIVGQSRITGVAESHDSAGTLALALKLHPDTREVVVVSDYTDTGIAMRQEFTAAVSQYPQVKISFLEEMPLDKILEKLKQLAPGSIVLMLTYTAEKEGRTFSQAEAARLLSSASPVPVYAMTAEKLGKGVVGGYMLEGEAQGQKAAELVMRILAGEDPANLPVITANISHAMFDYRLLHKFSINTAKLPQNAVVINKPAPTYAVNKAVFWLTIVFSTCSTLGLIVLIQNIRRRRSLEKSLRFQIVEYEQSQKNLEVTEEQLRKQIFDYLRIHDQLRTTQDELRIQLQAVAASEKKFRTILNDAVYAIITTTTDGLITSFNPAAERLLGYRADELICKQTPVIFHLAEEVTALADELSRRYNEAISGFKVFISQSLHGDMNQRDWTYVRKDGSHVAIRLDVTAMHDDSGQVVGYLGFAGDITEQRQLEAQIRQQQKMESIGLLAGGIAHDFNNMLAPIFIYAEMIRKKFAEDDPVYKRASIILDAAGRAHDLVRQLLSFSRKQILATRHYDLNEIITNFSDILQRTIRESVVISHLLSSSPCPVKADRTQIEQILLNLAVNAQDAISGNGSITIETGQVALDDEFCQLHPGSRPGRYVVLTVTDNGSGMDETTLSHIFDPFFSTKEVGKGTGLGLSTVYGIVKQHDGYITARSMPGQGTTFCIYLPLAAMPGEQKELALRNGATVTTQVSATILLVEDNEMVMNMTRELLENSGYTVLSAFQPEEALSVAHEHRGKIDLLLSDVVMPEMSGPELYCLLTEFLSDLPALYMSGYTGNQDVTMGGLGEKDICITKPFTAEALIDGVARMLTQK